MSETNKSARRLPLLWSATFAHTLNTWNIASSIAHVLLEMFKVPYQEKAILQLYIDLLVVIVTQNTSRYIKK